MNPLVSSSGFIIAVVILLTIIFYYIYYYFVTSKLPKKYCKTIVVPVQKKITIFLLKKGSGFLILGLIPGLLYYFLLHQNFEKFGISIDHFNKNFLIILSLILVITVILFLNQKANRQNNSLQINLSEWSILLFSINSIGWTFYLIGYEFLFRGILLFECYNSFRFWPAIAINVAIYSAIHMVNGKDQAIGSLVFGVIACYFTLSQSSILIPIIMHASLSILSDYFSIRYNKNLIFIRQVSFNLPQR